MDAALLLWHSPLGPPSGLELLIFHGVSDALSHWNPIFSLEAHQPAAVYMQDEYHHNALLLREHSAK